MEGCRWSDAFANEEDEVGEGSQSDTNVVTPCRTSLGDPGPRAGDVAVLDAVNLTLPPTPRACISKVPSGAAPAGNTPPLVPCFGDIVRGKNCPPLDSEAWPERDLRQGAWLWGCGALVIRSGEPWRQAAGAGCDAPRLAACGGSGKGGGGIPCPLGENCLTIVQTSADPPEEGAKEVLFLKPGEGAP